MKKKSVFVQIILVAAILLACIVTTVCVALLFGSVDTTLFDWKNLNFANMLPVFIVGGFLTCVIVGIAVIILSRSVFYKVRDYFFENNENKGDKDK